MLGVGNSSSFSFLPLGQRVASPSFPDVAGLQFLALLVVFARNTESFRLIVRKFPTVCSQLFSICLGFVLFFFPSKTRVTLQQENKQDT